MIPGDQRAIALREVTDTTQAMPFFMSKRAAIVPSTLVQLGQGDFALIQLWKA
jgi:hypothetical protein